MTKTKEEYNAYHRAYRSNNKEKLREYKKEYNSRWRKKYGYHNEWKSKLRYPEKEKARAKLRYLVSKGKIEKLPCEICGDKKSQAHHEDYNKPLEVIWLCSSHHSKQHPRGIPLKVTKIIIAKWRKRIENEKLLKQNRNLKIYQLRHKGLTLKKIAEKFNITHQRVQQICSSGLLKI